MPLLPIPLGYRYSLLVEEFARVSCMMDAFFSSTPSTVCGKSVEKQCNSLWREKWVFLPLAGSEHC